MSLTRSVDEVTQALVDFLEEQDVVPLKKVYYGDEERVPQTPSASVVVERESDQQGSSLRTVHTFSASIFLYHGDVKNKELTRRKCNQDAEKLEHLLNGNYLDGIVTMGLVTSLKPGYSARTEEVLLKSTSITWSATSRTVGR